MENPTAPAMSLADAEAAHAVLVAASKTALETFAQAQAIEAESLAALDALKASQPA